MTGAHLTQRETFRTCITLSIEPQPSGWASIYFSSLCWYFQDHLCTHSLTASCLENIWQANSLSTGQMLTGHSQYTNLLLDLLGDFDRPIVEGPSLSIFMKLTKMTAILIAPIPMMLQRCRRWDPNRRYAGGIPCKHPSFSSKPCARRSQDELMQMTATPLTGIIVFL